MENKFYPTDEQAKDLCVSCWYARMRTDICGIYCARIADTVTRKITSANAEKWSVKGVLSLWMMNTTVLTASGTGGQAMRDYEELARALREHSKRSSDCNSCPYYEADERGYVTCSEELAKEAADAIEELLLENDALGRSLCECDDLLKKLERENRRNTNGEQDEH